MEKLTLSENGIIMTLEDGSKFLINNFDARDMMEAMSVNSKQALSEFYDIGDLDG
jgi:hypothetical protein